eukprot:753880-Hanusia_phi.AAC.1
MTRTAGLAAQLQWIRGTVTVWPPRLTRDSPYSVLSRDCTGPGQPAPLYPIWSGSNRRGMAGRKAMLAVAVAMSAMHSCGSFSRSNLPDLVAPNTYKVLQKMVELAPPWPGPEGPRVSELEHSSEYHPGKPVETLEALERREASKKKLLETVVLMTRFPEVESRVRLLQESLAEHKNVLEELVYDEDVWWEAMSYTDGPNAGYRGNALNDIDEMRVVTYNGGIEPKWYWSQDVFQCNLCVKVKNDTRAKDVRVSLQKKHLRVQLRGETLVDDELAFHVRSVEARGQRQRGGHGGELGAASVWRHQARAGSLARDPASLVTQPCTDPPAQEHGGHFLQQLQRADPVGSSLPQPDQHRACMHRPVHGRALRPQHQEEALRGNPKRAARRDLHSCLDLLANRAL